jgi:hypothetical protein
MNAPHAEGETKLLECVVPGKNVLIDAIDERAIEIEEHGRRTRSLLGHRVGASSLHS